MAASSASVSVQPRGRAGVGIPPAHEWIGTFLRFRNPDDTWGDAVNLIGIEGPVGTAQRFNSVSHLQGSVISAGVELIETAGYWSAGGFGGCRYALMDPGDPIEDGEQSSLDGKRWRIVEFVLNWRMFGAKGNGVNPDAAAINACYRLASTTRRPCYGQGGIYYSGATAVEFKSVNYCRVYGDGPYVTVIQPDADAAVGIDCRAPAQTVSTLHVSDLSIGDPDSDPLDGAVAILHGNRGRTLFERIAIGSQFSAGSFDIGINLGVASPGMTIRDSEFNHCYRFGVFGGNGAGNFSAQNFRMERCTGRSCGVETSGAFRYLENGTCMFLDGNNDALCAISLWMVNCIDVTHFGEQIETTTIAPMKCGATCHKVDSFNNYLTQAGAPIGLVTLTNVINSVFDNDIVGFQLALDNDTCIGTIDMSAYTTYLAQTAGFVGAMPALAVSGYSGGWQAGNDSNHRAAGFRISPVDGALEWNGGALLKGTTPGLAFVLPSGYRPDKRRPLTGTDENGAYAGGVIYPNGEVHMAVCAGLRFMPASRTVLN